jgi:putative transposase
MAVHRKVYRFRMEPTRVQEPILNRLAGARRFVWNWALRRWKDHHEANGKSIGFKQLSAELTALKQQPETAWLREAGAQSLQQALRDLHRAFGNFFEKRARYPGFKSRKRDPLRFRIPQRVKVVSGKVHVPRVGHVRIRRSQPVTETTRSATFRRAPDGHWYVSLVVEFEMPEAALPPPDPATVVGIDLGLKEFALLSDGERVPAPKFFRRGERRLRAAQRALSRRRPGLNRRAKAREKAARIHQKIANQRGDFLHKLTTRIVNDHDGVCIEDLSLKGLVRTKLGKSFADASMGAFRRQLEYRSLWGRKYLAVIDRFYPWSRLCRGRGATNETLALSDRQWVCDCGMIHDRDLSAAVNIRDEGLRMLAVGHTDSPQRSGTGCQTADRQQPRLSRESHVLSPWRCQRFAAFPQC